MSSLETKAAQPKIGVLNNTMPQFIKKCYAALEEEPVSTTKTQHTPLFKLGRCIAHAEECCKICHAKRDAAKATTQMLEALERIANHPIGYGETFDDSPAMGVRPICHECKQKVDLAQAAIQKARGEKWTYI